MINKSNTDTKVWQYSMRFFQLIDWLKHEYSKRNNRFDRREGYEIIAKEDNGLFFSSTYIGLKINILNNF